MSIERLRDASLFDKETREKERKKGREKRRKLLLIYHDGSLGLELLVVISAEPSFSRPPNEFRPSFSAPLLAPPALPWMGDRLILYTKAPAMEDFRHNVPTDY